MHALSTIFHNELVSNKIVQKNQKFFLPYFLSFSDPFDTIH